MKKNHPRNHSSPPNANNYRCNQNNYRQNEPYRPHVQNIHNNINLSFDLRSETGSDQDDTNQDLHNFASITPRAQQDNYNTSTDSSTRRSQGHSSSSSTNNQGNAHSWSHPRLPRDSSEYSTGRRGDNRMQRGKPKGTRQSESETSDNILNSSRSPSGMSGLNDSSMVDSTSAQRVCCARSVSDGYVENQRWVAKSAHQNSNIWPKSKNTWGKPTIEQRNETNREWIAKSANQTPQNWPRSNNTWGTPTKEQRSETNREWIAKSANQPPQNWPRSNNTWGRPQCTTSNSNPPLPVVTEVMQQNAINNPIIESNYMPIIIELERDAISYHESYPDHFGPHIELGLSISYSPPDFYRLERAVNYARCKTHAEHPDNYVENNDESDNSDDDSDSDIITYPTPSNHENLYKFSMRCLNSRPLTLGFEQVGQRWDKIKCPCSESMDGWRLNMGCIINNHSPELCKGGNFTPQGLLDHCKAKSGGSTYHFFLMHYLMKLYCTDDGLLRPCIPNEFPRSDVDNRQIQDMVSNIYFQGYPQSIRSQNRHTGPTHAITISQNRRTRASHTMLRANSSIESVSATSSSASSSENTNVNNNVPVAPDVEIKHHLTLDELPSFAREYFTCPITTNIFQDPVMTADDTTYERSAIEHWFSTKDPPTSPMTNVELTSTTLRKNRMINNMITARIEELKAKYAVPIEDTKPSATDVTKPSSTRLNVPTEHKESIDETNPSATSRSVPQDSECTDVMVDDMSQISITNEEGTTVLDTTTLPKNCKPPAQLKYHSDDDPDDEGKPTIEPSASIPETVPTIKPVSKVARGSKRRRNSSKKTNQKKSSAGLARSNLASRIMKKIRQSLESHLEALKKDGWLNEENMKTDMPTTPSYSMMHSLKDGFQIVMWCCTHIHKLGQDFKVHRNCKIRFILPKNMGILWHEGLYHGGSKSRNKPDGTLYEDMRFFTYLWQYYEGSDKRKRNGDVNDGVSREWGRDLHRDYHDLHMCKDATTEGSVPCHKCNQGETVIDLTDILPTSYPRPGELILGDLQQYGWCIFRGVNIDDDTEAEIRRLVETGGPSSWKGIEPAEKGHKMKYDWNSKLPAAWDSPNLTRFQVNIKKFIYDRRLNKNPNYIIGRKNIIKNKSVIVVDQKPHFDYKPRINDILCKDTQRHTSLASMVIQLDSSDLMGIYARNVTHTLITMPINSKHGIKLSLDTPLNNTKNLNTIRPAGLRQLFANDVPVIRRSKKFVRRYTYGSGSGTSSVGMDPHNFVTRRMSPEMQYIGTKLHELLLRNRAFFNLEGVDLDQQFNHCTVIIYYADDCLKKQASLGMHCDCVYSPRDGKFKKKSNSQVENTPALIYSVGDERILNFKRRGMSKAGTWEDDDSFGTSYHLNSDTATIINSLDEDPLSYKNISKHSQYQHGGVKVNGTKLSFGLVFRVVSSEESYNLDTDTMIVDHDYDKNEIVEGIVGYDYVPFHNALQWLYYTRFY